MKFHNFLLAILFSPLKDKSHIFAPPYNILYIYHGFYVNCSVVNHSRLASEGPFQSEIKSAMSPWCMSELFSKFQEGLSFNTF